MPPPLGAEPRNPKLSVLTGASSSGRHSTGPSGPRVAGNQGCLHPWTSTDASVSLPQAPQPTPTPTVSTTPGIYPPDPPTHLSISQGNQPRGKLLGSPDPTAARRKGASPDRPQQTLTPEIETKRQANSNAHAQAIVSEAPRWKCDEGSGHSPLPPPPGEDDREDGKLPDRGVMGHRED